MSAGAHPTAQQSRPKALVMGARGRLGLALVRAFRDHGWDVLAQCRPGTTGQEPGVHWLPCDSADSAALAQAAAGASVVVHAMNVDYTQWERVAPQQMNEAIAAARQLDALLMFPGNVYGYGSGMPAVLTPQTRPQPDTRKGRLRVQLEQTLRDSGVRAVIVRAGDFYGCGSGSWLDRSIVKDIKKGKLAFFGSPEVATPWAYLPDLAATFERLAQRLALGSRTAGVEEFAFAGHVLSGRDWARLLQPLAQRQGWLPAGGQFKLGGLPWGLFKALSWAVPIFRELLEIRYLGQTPHQLDGSKLAGLLGPELPATPPDKAVAQALKDLRLVN